MIPRRPRIPVSLTALNRLSDFYHLVRRMNQKYGYHFTISEN